MSNIPDSLWRPHLLDARKLDRYTHDVTLTGGFCCRLTLADQNEWEEFAYKQPEFIALMMARREVAALGMIGAVPADEIYKALACRDDAERAMFAVGKRWYEALVARETAEAEAAKVNEETAKEDKP